MAITKSSVGVINNSFVTGGTKASPGASGSWVNCTTYYGGDIGISITNGSSAPGAPQIVTIQASPDNGTTIFDYYTVASDVVASSINTWTIALDAGVMYIRAICYGSTTNSVAVVSNLQAVTAI